MRTLLIGAVLLLSTLCLARNHEAPTLKCETYPGADGGQKLAACVAALPAGGGVADARGLTGDQVISTDVFAGAKGPGTLLLGETTFTLTGKSACFNVPSRWKVSGSYKSIFTGRGECPGVNGRTVVSSGSFVTLDGFKVEGNNTTEQCVALMDGHDNTVEYLWTDHCGQYGIVASANQPPHAGNAFENTQIIHNRVSNIGNAAGTGSIGIEVFPKSPEVFEKGERGEWRQISPAEKNRAVPETLRRGIVVSNNDVTAQPGLYVTGCGIKLSGADRGIVANNKVDLSGINLQKGNAGGICSVASDGVEISGNTVTGGMNGIAVSGLLDARNPHRATNMVIRGNQLVNQAENGFFSGEGQDGLVIENNTILHNNGQKAENGIYLMSNSAWVYRNARIQNNNISGYPVAIWTKTTGAVPRSAVVGNQTEGRVVVQ